MREMRAEFWLQRQKGRDHSEDVDVVERSMLK